MASDEVDFRTERRGPALVLTFAAERTRNALNRTTRVELVEELRRADADDGVRVVILTGMDPAFSSGVDAKELLATPDYVAPAVDPPTALRSSRTPTIAAVNGACVSGGLEIALACSFVIASERATFADTHAKIGLTPGWSLSAELPAAIGVRRARQLTLTGQPIDARTALSWGLVNEVLPHERLIARALELGDAIAALEAAVIRNALSVYAEGHDARLADARRIEAAALAAWNVDRTDARARFDGSTGGANG
jgi:enoyl-CoA hydratase